MKHTEPECLCIDRYMAGELDENEAKALKAHLDECEVCAAYFCEIKNEDQEFLKRYPFAVFKNANFETKVQAVPERKPFGAFLSRPLLVPAFVFLLFIIGAVPYMSIKNSTAYVAFKGNPSISFLCKRDSVISKGDLSQAYRCNDRIQVVYNSQKEQFIALFSIDSKGTVSFYHTDNGSGNCSVKTGAGSELSFPNSIVLDSSRGGELIVAAFSKNALKTPQIEKWVEKISEKNGTLPELQKSIESESFGKSTFVTTLLIKKEMAE